jgi:hypothetical protein
MKHFIINITIITISLALIGWLVFSQFIPQYYLPVLPFLLLFFAGSSVFIHAYQLRLAKKDFSKFTRSNMLITFFKLFLYSAVAVVYIAFDTANAKMFVICLMLLYVVFTVFEVTSLISKPTKDRKDE